LRFAYATGIQAPALDQIIPTAFTRGNSDLKAEENRSFEAGVQQELASGRYSLSLGFFENDFRRQIEFCCFDPATGLSQYVNLNRSVARGAEFEGHARLKGRLSLDGSYTNLSTRILDSGGPLLRRPKHSGNLMLDYAAAKWGGNLGGSFVGRRTDSDFFALPSNQSINHAPGYARVDVGGWYRIHSRITAYVNLENALNRHYEEVVGYPALRANFRAGLRFRLGGE
jgi:outer membrane receptor protein involved in Fe transport